MKRQFIRSERAHFMCPDMHFSMLMELASPFSEEKVCETVGHLSRAHPFLSSVIAEEDGQLFYDIGKSQPEIAFLKDIPALWDACRELPEKDWDIFTSGLLKVFACPCETGTAVLLIAHHLLTDGRGLLDLAGEFAACYAAGTMPVYAEEQLIGSVADLPEKSALSGISKLLVRRANAQWRKENRKVSYEQYRKFAVEYGKAHPVEYDCYTVEKPEMEEMRLLCKENGISVNDLLMAKMYLQTGCDKIIIAADIRDRFARYVKGSMGNYSTAMGIRFKARSADPVETAKQVRKAVQKAMGNNRSLMLILACYFEMDSGLLDAAAISALGGFASKAASFVGGGMFGFGGKGSYSITNLGKLDDENIRALTFIPPASPAARYTLGVVTLNGVMRACGSRTKA